MAEPFSSAKSIALLDDGSAFVSLYEDEHTSLNKISADGKTVTPVAYGHHGYEILVRDSSNRVYASEFGDGSDNPIIVRRFLPSGEEDAAFAPPQIHPPYFWHDEQPLISREGAVYLSGYLVGVDDTTETFGIGGNYIVKLQTESASPIAQAQDGRIVILGTAGNDVVRVSRDGPKLKIVFNNTTRLFDFDTVTALGVDLGGGNDRFAADPHLSLRMTVNGGAGNDTIATAAGDDQLTGGSGADQLFGGNGEDAFYAADHTRDTLNGGTGDYDIAYTADPTDILTSIESGSVSATQLPTSRGLLARK